MPRLKKLVLTGAAGRLGSYLRKPLTLLADELVSSDIVDEIGNLYPGETYNVWEAAYQQGLTRVVYASSIHAVGMHKRHDFIGTDVPHRPDTYYGLAKCFAEDLGSLYWDKRGLESVCMRILSCAQVTSARALGTWLSYDDLIKLVTRSIDTPTTGFNVVYGISNNDRAPVDNSKASHLGYRPKDNAEQFAEKILAEADAADTNDAAQMYHGGPFAAIELGNSGLATMDIVDDTKKT